MRLSEQCFHEDCQLPHKYVSYARGPIRYNFCCEDHMVAQLRLELDQANQAFCQSLIENGEGIARTFDVHTARP